jgi:hypothetical protein
MSAASERDARLRGYAASVGASLTAADIRSLMEERDRAHLACQLAHDTIQSCLNDIPDPAYDKVWARFNDAMKATRRAVEES